ncbi:MAG: YceI family protein [Flavobacteriales bacterium]
MQLRNLLLSTAAAAAIGYAATPKEYTLKLDEATVAYAFPHEEVTGSISGLDAKITFDPTDLSASSISGTVDVSTIDTGINGRNKHLQAGTYFDADNHPKLSFKSSSIDKTNAGYVMKGDLTMKGKTLPVTWNFTFDNGTFVGNTSIFTSDFGVFGKKQEKSQVNITVTAPVKSS